MTTYQELDYRLDEITLILKHNNISEYTKTSEVDGVFYRQSIRKLKRKPKEDNDAD